MEVVNTNSCQLFQTITFAGTVSTVSLKVKPGTSSSLTMRYISYDTNITVQFNMSTLLANHSSGKITALAGGYFLCTLTVSLAGTDMSGQVYFYIATDTNTNYSANVGNSMYVWQAQAEEKAHVTSFVDGTRQDHYRTDRDTSGGDLATEEGLETAVVISLFTDRRAAKTDQLPTGETDRRGCWQDATLEALPAGTRDPGIGSMLWLLQREKTMSTVLARAKQYAEQALAWMIEDRIAESITVTAERSGAPGSDRMTLRVEIRRPKRPAITYRYDYNWTAQESRAA
jgi:phage gp46-like protein